jgi:hypothetical protein
MRAALNRQLLKVLDAVEKRTPKIEHQSAYHEKLSDVMTTSGWRVAITTMVVYFLFETVCELSKLLGWWGLLISLPAAVVALAVIAATIGVSSRRGSVEYMRWIRRQAHERKRRLARIRAPYERQSPVATATCMECKAQIGERHRRDCPTIPEGWFTQRGR